MEDKMTRYLNAFNLGQVLPGVAKLVIAVSVMVLSMAMFIASINRAMAAPVDASQPRPVASVTVTGDSITLGDVFAPVRDKDADFFLAPAPRPGTDLTWDARTINRIARAFGYDWTAGAGDTITIRRLGTLVTEDMIRKAILAKLAESGKETGRIDLEFLNAETADIILPPDVDATITVIEASHNPARKTFSAQITLPGGEARTLAGLAHPVIDIPVLKNGARRGETIGRNDITTIPVRAGDIHEGMALGAEELVGMTPRKVINARAPILTADLDKPVLVKRGELITMQLKRGAIQVTALAKALESGTQGEIIRLMNIDSKRTIEAEVTGPRTASVAF